MIRFFPKVFVLVFCAALTAAGLTLCTSSDPICKLQSWLALGRYSAHDALISAAAKKRGLDPLLVKAMVWRESAFDPTKIGTSGERGLMQVGEAAAQDWAKAEKIETFVKTDLFDAKTNLDVGTWYLKQALAILLVFIGSKIFVSDFLMGGTKFPPVLSLVVTFALILGGILWSLWKTRVAVPAR